MISGTDFVLERPEMVTMVCSGLPASVATASEIEEIRAECEAGRALCLCGPDGLVVFDVRAHGEALEMFVWIAVALKHGAFERQVPALLAIARELRAETIAFQSRRRGWARRLDLSWFRRGSDEFVRWVE